MGFLDFLFGKPKQSYAGGSGSTIKDAVIITATSSSAGVKAEYAYVQQVCGLPNVDWTLHMQSLTEGPDGKPYDLLTIKLNDGSQREFYFDISAFYGKF